MSQVLTEVCRYAVSRRSSRTFRFALVDFSIVHNDLSAHLRSRMRDLRDAFIQRFSIENPDPAQLPTWVILLVWPKIFPEVIEFLHFLHSQSLSHATVIISFGDRTEFGLPHLYNVFFPMSLTEPNYELIFAHLADDANVRRIPRNVDRSFPLQLHANSISSGLCFNYFYSYLNRQIGLTNTIFLSFVFDGILPVERFPPYLSVEFVTHIEEVYLHPHRTTEVSPTTLRKTWGSFQLNFDPLAHRVTNDRQTNVQYVIADIGDLGSIVETLRIFERNFHLDALETLNLRDDFRHWNFIYDGPERTDGDAVIFDQRDEPLLHQCQFLPRRDDVQMGKDLGVCTLKRSSDVTLARYKSDHREIEEVRMIPRYFLIASSSCDFDSLENGTIRLARLSNGEVLESPRMHQYSRSLCRTFYYFDEKNIRYLFCAEYPFILSVLRRMEEQGLISRAQRCEEYHRFCNMLNRVLSLHGLTDSAKLIEFDDDGEHPPSLSDRIRREINEFEEHSLNSTLNFDALLRTSEAMRSVRIFAPKETEPIRRALEEKLRTNGYQIFPSHNAEAEQTIFICTNDRKRNEKIIDDALNRMNERGTLRDVFVFLDGAITNFPATFIRLVPFVTLDRPNDQSKVDEVFDYLQKMNVLSRNYAAESNLFSPAFEQVTSIGSGCAAAFYFNYIRIIVPHPQHHDRMERELDDDDETVEPEAIFVRRWLFVLPWTIENAGRLIDEAMRLGSETGIHLSLWKQSQRSVVLTAGGIVNRSYSGLKIYRLANGDGRVFYFPMEIPQAFVGLQNRYETLQSQFHFGRFDPREQAKVFQENFLEFERREVGRECLDGILAVPLEKPAALNDEDQPTVLLETLWNVLCRSIEIKC